MVCVEWTDLAGTFRVTDRKSIDLREVLCLTIITDIHTSARKRVLTQVKFSPYGTELGFPYWYNYSKVYSTVTPLWDPRYRSRNVRNLHKCPKHEISTCEYIGDFFQNWSVSDMLFRTEMGDKVMQFSLLKS